MSNLENIHFLISDYCIKHNDFLPANLGVIFDLNLGGGEFFISKMSRKTPPKNGKELILEHDDFIYLGNKKNKLLLDSEKPLIVTRPELYNSNSIIVVFHNGKVVEYKEVPPEIKTVINSMSTHKF